MRPDTAMTKQVIIVGCGIIGAMTAYEFSHLPGLDIRVLDQQPPAQASTGAALGVLVGILSQKVKGRNWRLRQRSVERYATLIPELEEALHRTLPVNNQGLLNLCFDAAELPRWESLQAIRHSQGYPLEIWSPDQLRERCPDIQSPQLAGAVYSPQDRQLDPTAFTLALVEAAQQRGVQFQFDCPVQGLAVAGSTVEVSTPAATYPADFVVIAAGLGSPALTGYLQPAVPIGPVLGQALRLHLDCPLNRPEFQPAISGNDIHLVPLGNGDYWVGATVEFPPDTNPAAVAALQPEAERLEAVLQGAVAYCPALAQGTVTQTWYGLRPRPQGQAAPVMLSVGNHPQVWLASGHYRNGVLLAPATALQMRETAAQVLGLG